MQTLEFLGFHQDGRHLTLTDARGNRYLLEISDELLSTLSSLLDQVKDSPLCFNTAIPVADSSVLKPAISLEDKPENIKDSTNAEISVLDDDSEDLEFVPTTLPPLRPREVQELLRSGVDAVDIAQRHGMNLDRIRVYETPIVAEREYICAQAQKIILGADGGPELQDVVVDRLAAFNIAPEDITWDAIRPVDGNWQLKLSFPFQGVIQQANWQVDIDHGLLQPLSASAKWFSETQMTAHPGDLLDLMEGKNTRFDARRRSNTDSNNSAPSFTPTSPTSADLSPYSQTDLPDNSAINNTIDFLDRLDAHRGTRQPVLIPTENELSEDLDSDYLDLNSFTDHSESPDLNESSQLASPLEEDPSDLFSYVDSVSIAEINSRNANEVDEALKSAEETSSTEQTDAHNFTNVVKLPAHEKMTHKPGWDSLVNAELNPSIEKDETAKLANEDLSPDHSSKLAADSELNPSSLTPNTRKRKPSSKKQRRSVPSWEEIVFGTKPDAE